jgi:hypothetical protein
MNINRKKIFNWLKIIVIVYCVIGIALYYLQEKFLFHPKKLDSSYVFKFDTPFEEVKIPVNKEDTISMIKFFPKDSLRKGVVIYYHGNMENVEHYARFADNFTKHSYEVWMEDYPGYGKSTGIRTEKKLYEQALQVQKLAAGKYSTDSIIIYGRSFGTGIATYVASVTNCKKLILESAYYSIPDLFNSFSFIYPSNAMSNYKIPAYEFMQDVKAPVIIFHGTDDWMIPYRCALKLKKGLKQKDKFISIPGGAHNNLRDFKQFRASLDSLLQ